MEAKENPSKQARLDLIMQLDLTWAIKEISFIFKDLDK